ncbi:histidine phosphatase superfamily [Delphinella strobiligena]|nr:histidine phosphatase superfamily [Delphinella strobiligena]
MSNKKITPRVFIIRHGETEWSLNGRHTGISDIPLTKDGEKRIRATGKALVGDDRLIVPRNLAHIYVSPRTRAQRTLELLNLGCSEPMPWTESPPEHPDQDVRTKAKVQVTEAVREWDYGDYEGVTSAEIAAQRKEQGLPKWDIWHDGCPRGESPEQISKRLDDLIDEIRERFHKQAIGKPVGSASPHDVLIVAHGHVLRSFAARWIDKNIADNPSLILDAGGVGTLSYEHHSIDEPAILLGGGFMVDVVENAAEQEKKK